VNKKDCFCVGVIVLIALNSVGFSEGFRKHPYLQNVKTDEITICWKIAQPADTNNTDLYRLEYGIDSYANVVPYPVAYPTDSRLFQLPLGSLQPETIYQYRVRSGSEWSGEATFSTAVQNNEPFTFAVYGDTQLRAGRPTDNQEDVANLIDSYSPDFIIHCGDMWFTNQGPDVDVFFEVSKDLMKDIPLFPAVGNHEFWTNTSPGVGTYTTPERYKRYFVVPTNLISNEDYYSFDYGNSHFIVTNANLAEGGPDYRVGSDQHTAIENDLIIASNDTNIAHIFAVVHKPAHSNGSKHGCGHGSVIEDPNISVDLGELFQEYDVDIVFSGHDHNYQRFQPVDSNHQQIWICDPPGDPNDPNNSCNIITSGVTYVVTGGGGYELSNVDPAGGIEDCPAPLPGCDLPTPQLTSIAAEETFHAMFVRVEGEEVHVRVIDTNDSVIDRFRVVTPLYCLDKPLSDLDGDCRVTWRDFAIMASEFLDCGRYDQSTCPQ